MASKAIRPLAQAVAVVFAGSPEAGHFERRFCKYVPRHLRDSFRGIIEACSPLCSLPVFLERCLDRC